MTMRVAEMAAGSMMAGGVVPATGCCPVPKSFAIRIEGDYAVLSPREHRSIVCGECHAKRWALERLGAHQAPGLVVEVQSGVAGTDLLVHRQISPVGRHGYVLDGRGDD